MNTTIINTGRGLLFIEERDRLANIVRSHEAQILRMTTERLCLIAERDRLRRQWLAEMDIVLGGGA